MEFFVWVCFFFRSSLAVVAVGGSEQEFFEWGELLASCGMLFFHLDCVCKNILSQIRWRHDPWVGEDYKTKFCFCCSKPKTWTSNNQNFPNFIYLLISDAMERKDFPMTRCSKKKFSIVFSSLVGLIYYLRMCHVLVKWFRRQCVLKYRKPTLR